MMTFLPVFARTFLKAPRHCALPLGVGVGSIVGALTIAALGNMKHKGRNALIMLTILGAGIGGFALTVLWVAASLLFISAPR